MENACGAFCPRLGTIERIPKEIVVFTPIGGPIDIRLAIGQDGLPNAQTNNGRSLSKYWKKLTDFRPRNKSVRLW